MSTGGQVLMAWGLEANFGVEATTVDIAFGYNLELTSLEADNNTSPRRGLGNRNIQKMGYGEFKGSMGLKFDFNDPFVLRIMTGGYSASGTSGNWTYTFPEADVLPSFTVYDFIKNIDGGANVLRKFVGCVVDNWNIDVSVGGEPVSVTLNILFANIIEDSDTQTAVIPTTDVLTYAQTKWKKASVQIAKVESLSIKCNQNAEEKAYLGDRFAQRAKFGERDYSVTCTNYFGSTGTYLTDFYGSTPNTGPKQTGPVAKTYTLEITPSAGQTAATYVFTFSGVYPVKHSQPQKVGDDVMEEVELTPTSLSIVASAAPQAKPTGWA